MKKWIKLLVAFLVFMWVCTIISKSIYVSKLPQVKTEKPSKRYIEHVVEADGIVAAGAEQAVNTLSGLRVSEICIQEGDYVEESDILFRIDVNDLSDIISAKEAELMKLQYQLADTQFNQILDALREKLRATASAEVLSPMDTTENVQEIEIAGIQKELSELYEVQAKKGEIKADKSGYILSIQVTVGNRTSDATAILLSDENAPYQFRFSITKEQRKYLHLDDKIELEIRNKCLELNVDYMEGNSADGYDITCKLSENIEKPGISGNIRKAEQGELHYVTIPAEAIHEESKNYFIYALKEKMGILGKECYVEKIKVSILDQNDKFVALKEGAIGADMDVIISYSKEIKQGDIVRLTEE